MPRLFRGLAILVVVVLTGAVAYMALRSSPYLQELPWLPSSLTRWADRHGVVRNTVAFCGLGFVVFLLLGTGPRLACAIGGFGTAVEVAQIWIPGRTFDWKDILASWAGVVLAWPLAWWLRRRWRGGRFGH